MAAAVIASLSLIAAAAVVGTAICHLGGLREVRGAAPAVGLAALMGLAAPAVRLSSDPTWVAVALGVLVAAALSVRSVRRALRERAGDLATVTSGALALMCLP